MPVSWKRIVEQQKIYGIGDFQKAAMRLLTEQIIYQANPKQRSDYDLIAAYENEFIEALDLFGCKLDHNRHERYVAAIPTNADASKIPLMHTLLALVLRKLYDYHMNRGSLSAGIAAVGIPELETAFKESTGRELPMKPQTELLNLLGSMKRWGIARPTRTDNLGEITWYVEILPGIQSLITERSLAMLKEHAEALYNPDTAQTETTGDSQEEESV